MNSLYSLLSKQNINTQNFLESFFGSSRDFFFSVVLNEHGVFEYSYANKNYTEFLYNGLNVPVEGRLFGNELKKETAGEVINKFHTVLKERKNKTISVLFNLNGRSNVLTADLIPLIDAGNRASSVFVCAKDSTEKYMMESELIKSKNEAEEANRMKSALLTNMSHEIRTPLNGIIGFSELLRDEVDSDYHREMTISILQSAKRLLGTLQSIMELSRLESAPTPLYNSKIDLLYLLDKISAEFENTAYAKNLYFRKDFPELKIFLHIDDYLFTQAVRSILENAVKFTKQGGVTLRVYSKYEDEHYYAFIEIIDTGIGIEEKDQKVIFDKFIQVSAGHNRDYEGMGLGLTLAKLAVELLKGEIALKSRVNAGTKVQLKFSALIGDKPETAVLKQYPALLPEETKKILVVEDNYYNQKLLSFYINSDYEIDFAFNGDKALELIQGNKYCCAIMDIDLGPGMNGLDILNFIKKQEQLKYLPVIAITGFSSVHDRNNLLSKGFDAYISKPFEKETVVSVLNQFMQAEMS